MSAEDIIMIKGRVVFGSMNKVVFGEPTAKFLI
jgi:hypothetical protein